MSFPIRQDITVLPADDSDEDKEFDHDAITITSRGELGEKTRPRNLKLGWSVYETIGVAIVNPRGCAAGKKSVIVGDE